MVRPLCIEALLGPSEQPSSNFAYAGLSAHENEPTCAQSCGPTECADMMTMPVINSTCSTNSSRPESRCASGPPSFWPFFCSTAPQGFFCPDRRSPRPPRAGAVKAGRLSVIQALRSVSRPRLDSSEHGGSIGRSGPERLAGTSANKLQSASQSDRQIQTDGVSRRW